MAKRVSASNSPWMPPRYSSSSAIDQLQRGLDRHRAVVGLEHGLVAREDAHAGADGRLRHVGRGDVGGLKLGDGRGQFAFQGADELGAGDGVGCGFLLAADEDDRVGEGVGARCDHSVRHLGSHWPSADDRIARLNDCLQKCRPTSRTDAFLLNFALLEGIVDRCRIIRLTTAAPCLRMASVIPFKKKLFCCSLAAMAIRRCDELFSFRRCKNAEIAPDKLSVNDAPQPNIKEIRKISISDIIVVRWISGNHALSG